MARRGTSPDGTKAERRKAQRFPVTVPIEVSWRGSDGIAIKEQAIARQVNANGGQLEMSSYPDVGNRITLTNFLSAETAEARVLATPHSREGVSHGIVVELIISSESFWGVNLQVKKASVELQKLEDSLRSEGIDLRVLNEFRDAVEYIRTAAVVVQQLREHQMHGRCHRRHGRGKGYGRWQGRGGAIPIPRASLRSPETSLEESRTRSISYLSDLVCLS